MGKAHCIEIANAFNHSAYCFLIALFRSSNDLNLNRIYVNLATAKNREVQHAVIQETSLQYQPRGAWHASSLGSLGYSNLCGSHRHIEQVKGGQSLCLYEGF